MGAGPGVGTGLWGGNFVWLIFLILILLLLGIN
jgi:hypothetical protein